MLMIASFADYIQLDEIYQDYLTKIKDYYIGLDMYYLNKQFYHNMAVAATLIDKCLKDGKWYGSKYEGCKTPSDVMRLVFISLAHFSFYLSDNIGWAYVCGLRDFGYITSRRTAKYILTALYFNIMCMRSLGLDITINAFKHIQVAGGDMIFKRDIIKKVLRTIFLMEVISY